MKHVCNINFHPYKWPKPFFNQEAGGQKQGHRATQCVCVFHTDVQKTKQFLNKRKHNQIILSIRSNYQHFFNKPTMCQITYPSVAYLFMTSALNYLKVIFYSSI